jgi:hypothetical protein
MGVTCGCVRAPGSLTLPILVGCIVFSTSSKTQYTPRQSCGTRLRAVFAVRNQHTVQVTPVEGSETVDKQRTMAAVIATSGKDNAVQKEFLFETVDRCIRLC